MVGFQNRGGPFHSGVSQFVGFIDLQNPVFLHDPDQHEQTEHCIQVHRCLKHQQR